MFSKSKLNKIRLRFKILWAAIKNVFTGKGIWLNGPIYINIGKPELSYETWIKKDCKESDWEHWSCFFDGNPPKGYINGTQIK